MSFFCCVSFGERKKRPYRRDPARRLPGALAARCYESAAFDSTQEEAVARTLRGGCFAVGLLILLTQAQVHSTLRGTLSQPTDSSLRVL